MYVIINLIACMLINATAEGPAQKKHEIGDDQAIFYT